MLSSMPSWKLPFRASMRRPSPESDAPECSIIRHHARQFLRRAVSRHHGGRQPWAGIPGFRWLLARDGIRVLGYVKQIGDIVAPVADPKSLTLEQVEATPVR